jgi:hypothetical protein
MFRRATVELVLPDDIDVGRYGADTVLAVGAHVLGGSILLAAPVALYRRHGANSHSDMPVHGACAMPVRTVAPTLERVIRVLAEHIARHHDRLAHEVGAHHLARVLQHAGLSLLPGAAPWWLQGVDPDGWAGRRLSVAGVFPAETTGLRLSLEVPGWPAAPPHVAAAITRDAAAPLHLRLAPGLWTIALPAGGTGRLERTTIDLAPDTAMPGEQRRRTVRVLQIAQAMPGDGFVPWQVERFGPEC